jgi:hypothetical protein
MKGKWLGLMMLAGPGWMGATLYYLCDLAWRTPYRGTFDTLISWAALLLLCAALLLCPGSQLGWSSTKFTMNFECESWN